MPVKSQDDCLKFQADLDAAANSEEDWLMTFHPDKCDVLSLTTKRQPLQHRYSLHTHILENVTSAKT